MDRSLRRHTVLSLLVVAVLATFCTKTPTPSAPAGTPAPFVVYELSIVEIEPIAELRAGFREAFLASHFAKRRRVEFVSKNAQGDTTLINQIADQVAVAKPDLAYVLGTPLAQAVQARAPDVLLVQGAATDPVAAGLAASWTGSARRYIASSDLPSADQIVSVMRSVTPAAVRIGVIYNPGETNSVAVVKRYKESASRSGLTVVERGVANTSEVPQVLASLVGKIDALFIPPDNTVHAALRAIGHFANSEKLPIYATVSSALDEGALISVGQDFKELGREAARVALLAVTGTEPGKIPIRISNSGQVTMSAAAAKHLGVDVATVRARQPSITVR